MIWHGVLQGLQCGYLLWRGPLLWFIPALPWSPPWDVGNSLLWCLEYFAPFSSLTSMFPPLFFTQYFSSLLILLCSVSSFLKYVNLWTQSVPSLNNGVCCALQWDGWSWLELAVSSTGQSLAVPHRGHPAPCPLARPCHINPMQNSPRNVRNLKTLVQLIQ